MVKIGLIGFGYWGPNLARNFAEQSRAKMSKICDYRADRRALAKSRYPSCEVISDHREIIEDPTIDAVLIATPVFTHADLAEQAICSGKHVWVEKPMCETVADCIRLNRLAREQNRVLLVDHTFIYTGAVRKIKELIDNGDIGDIFYFDSVRVNLGLFQQDVNVVWDLATHDVAIMDYLLGRLPRRVTATGACHTGTGIENIAYITVDFGENLLGHIHVNWLSPVKVRTMLIGGSRKMILYDDNEPSEKVRVYDKGINFVALGSDVEKVYTAMTQYRIGDMWSPRLDGQEALRYESAHFLDCIESGKDPITNGEVGLRVVRILEAASQSIQQGGIPVIL